MKRKNYDSTGLWRRNKKGEMENEIYGQNGTRGRGLRNQSNRTEEPKYQAKQ